ncbi:ABC transporter ATP-binding protein [Sagittula sp. NFXS13]|uniref:dipeptide ABC transporter ATP-binding protein n=1 Tax=Sagittula sp. NFXS13 TaxID=2819095 RepID=UPI0032DFFECF
MPHAEAAAPLLSLRDLSVAIRGRGLLHDVSLDIAPGEVVALTGESGSGKSLTALATMGLLPSRAQISGTLRFAGQELLPLAEPQRAALRGQHMSMIFQEPMTALNPLQTIGQQIAEVCAIHRAPPPDLAALLDRVGLDLPPSRYPHELSGGQRQRVVIAMAVALRPKLIIADEPTTALDVTTQSQILTLLKDLTRQHGSALMMITHDLAVVADMADRIVVMNKGHVVETATTATLLAAPQHAYTQSLLAASAHRTKLPPRAVGGRLMAARDVTITYPGARRLLRGPAPVPAVQKVSFDIRKGERLGLVGESGCGKSTLSRALLGLQPLAEGEITLDGAPINTRAARQRIQVVFQDPYGSFNPRHRVRRLLAEPLHLLDHRPSRRDVDASIARALTDVGLSPDDAEKHIHAFSGGQRQRLAIARALVISPELIVLDEAVSALDVRVRAKVLDLLADLSAKRGLAWLFISHDLSVVRSVTDRVLVMDKGQIVEDAATQALFDRPAHPVTRRLLAAAPRGV